MTARKSSPLLKFLGKMLPRTVAGQLIAMLAIVLLLAQVINLALLVGERRFAARNNTFQTAIDMTVEALTGLPETLPTRMPYVISSFTGEMNGAMFLSRTNRAGRSTESVELQKYNRRLLSTLENLNLRHLNTTFMFLPKGPPKRPRSFGNRPESFGAGGQDARPPLNENARGNQGFRPSGPPPQQGGEQGRGRLSGPEGFPPLTDGGFYHPARMPHEETLNITPLQEVRISVEVAEGVWFNLLLPHARQESLTGRIVLSTLLLFGLTLFAAWVFTRRISRPLLEFSVAAERLGQGRGDDFLPETGPEDIRRAATTFNQMQRRLTRMLESQRTMLRAVGHDLRTPLTSLRLRAEAIPDELGREKFIAIIDDMGVMTEEILSWAKDASGTEPVEAVDLCTFIESLTDDYCDSGRPVSLDEFAPCVLHCRRVSIKRALQNLINNALKYGKTAHLSVVQDDDFFHINVDDTGPGVPEEHLEELLKPFVRLELSRNKDTGGTGLGLSISETIAQIHGGKLTLTNLKPVGLRATLSLPYS